MLENDSNMGSIRDEVPDVYLVRACSRLVRRRCIRFGRRRCIAAALFHGWVTKALG